MKQSEKMKNMTPEERAAWQKSMADKRAAKKAAKAQEGSAHVVDQDKPKPKPAKKPAASPAAGSGGDDDDDGIFL